MFLKNILLKGPLLQQELAKPVVQKLFKSCVVLLTTPAKRGDKLQVDNYQGVVKGMDLWYVKLKAPNRSIFIPTSYFYDKVISIME